MAAALDLDLYDGVAYVGLIPFAIEQARPVGAPARLALAFLETNVRTYVHRDGRDPGVYFFSLDAASWLAVAGARLGFGLPYFPARMALRAHGGVVDYTLRRRAGPRGALAVRYAVGDYRGPSAPGTLEHFLIERYVLYVERGRALWTARVHHRPYPVHDARLLRLDESLFAADGLPPASGPPPHVHYASLVDVDIFAPTRVARSPALASAVSP